MIAKIEIYNDDGELVSVLKNIPYYKKWIDTDGTYEISKYEFRALYAECKPVHPKDI